MEDKIKPEGRHLAEKWLDTQKDASVIYAAFGPGVFFSPEQIRELAHGLEASEQPFVLVLQLSETDNSEAEYLPPGFEERTKRARSCGDRLGTASAHPKPSGRGADARMANDGRAENELQVTLPSLISGCIHLNLDPSWTNPHMACDHSLRNGLRLEGLERHES